MLVKVNYEANILDYTMSIFIFVYIVIFFTVFLTKLIVKSPVDGLEKNFFSNYGYP